MSVEHAIQVLLERLSDSQVEALASACATRHSPGATLGEAVVGASPAGQAAVAELSDAWAGVERLTGAGIALALRIGLAARRDADARRSRAVWTGPCAAGEQRLTAAVLRGLIQSARETVLVLSYAAYTLPGLADDLAAAVKRGCAVDVVFETEEDSGGQYSGFGEVPFGSVAGVTRWRWPAEHREDGDAVLHAKLLVIDGRRALVGSANLTQRALSRNLEAGVLIEDPSLAAAFEGHVRKLMGEGVLQQA